MIDELRRRYPRFVYEEFKTEVSQDGLVFSFSFKIEPDINFSPEVLIHGVSEKDISSIGKEAVDNFAFHLGLMEIPSYWKTTCSPKIIIKAGGMDDYQISWWHDLIIRGMGQFFYENEIDFAEDDFVQVQSDASVKEARSLPEVAGSRALIPVGGGKDSAVTLELLSKNIEDVGAFVLNPTKAAKGLTRIANVRDIVTVERKIDQKLLQLNEQGFLNGHTPFSAYLAFLSTICAVLFDYRNITFSNERSSNEENISYLGYKVNHQYSKTFEFENKFREYNLRYLTKNINYFSFLRPLYEIQISKVFAKFKKYHKEFRSCNVGQKTNVFCCRCPKCLSTFILLYPFLGPAETTDIFGKNLYEDRSLFPTLEAMVAKDKVKPFECLGTREEIKIGLFLSKKQHKDKLPVLLEMIDQKYISRENMAKRTRKILEAWDENNNLPQEFQEILQKVL